ncbi:MAG: restriction alleviation protein, Lar family [Clostridiales bacterium]|nr:restriction alleviation protein, Lar family [Clostridiales bacterium]
MEKLKPCPFCGGEAKLQTDIRYPRPKCDAKTAYEVVCQTWGCIIGFVDERYRLSKDEAIKAWNTRAGEEQ